MGRFRAGILAGLLTLSACSSTEPGAATPQAAGNETTGQSTSQPPSTTPLTTSSKSRTARPKTVDLKPFEPCTVLQNLAAEFGFQGKTPTPGRSAAFPGSAECIVINSAPVFGLAITHAVNVDTAEFGATANGKSSPLTVEGFPGFLLEGQYGSECYVGLDVADKQMFYLQWSYNRPSGVPPMSELCANATKAATSAMKVLIAS